LRERALERKSPEFHDRWQLIDSFVPQFTLGRGGGDCTVSYYYISLVISAE
jgi:hypothetical protein